jgi:LysM repeat protein
MDNTIEPGDTVQLIDPDKYTGTQPGDTYTVTRVPHGFVEIKSPAGKYLTVQPADLTRA